MRLLVTGGRTGHLGRRVVQLAEAEHDVIAVGSTDADVRDRAAVEALLERHRPHAVVHTAYVQDDWDVTATGAAHVAHAASRTGARVVLVSSDVVFGGSDHPYTESAPTDPVSAYGRAKAAAEAAVLGSSPDAVVARTSLILGDGASKHERLVHALAGGADGALFEDERRCPVHVDDLAGALVELACNDVQGLLHLGGGEPVSRLELGRLVARRDGLDAATLRPGRRADLSDPGPIDVRLDSTLAATVLATRLRGASEFLASCRRRPDRQASGPSRLGGARHARPDQPGRLSSRAPDEVPCTACRPRPGTTYGLRWGSGDATGARGR